MKLPPRMQLNQSGALSFMSVVIFMIIITTVTLAYMQSVTRQQRDAQNYDFSTRAYYAAESGVQDGVRKIRSGDLAGEGGNKESCAPTGAGAIDTGVIGASEDYGLGYTCQLISSRVVSGVVTPGKDYVTIRLQPQSGPLPDNPTVVIKWGIPGTVDPTPTEVRYFNRGDSDQYFMSTVNWNQGGLEDDDPDAKPILPVLRTALITHPAVPFERSNIQQRVFFLNPVDSGGGVTSEDVIFGAAASAQQDLVTNTRCTDGATPGMMACTMRMEVKPFTSSSNELYINLSAVYRSAYFEISVQDGDGNEVPLGDATATIDVTGRAGDSVYRRVRQTVAVGNNFKQEQGPNAALVSAEGICKSFSITNDASGFDSDCDPLAAH